MSPARPPWSRPFCHVSIRKWVRIFIGRRRGNGLAVVMAALGNAAAPRWDTWRQDGASAAPSASDVLWPAAGAFLAMAIFGKMDQILAPCGVSVTIAPLGAIAPSARKYNIFMAG